jgi:hypothetical protein
VLDRTSLLPAATWRAPCRASSGGTAVRERLGIMVVSVDIDAAVVDCQRCQRLD